jgi:glyoxylase-like metal-dependent hydrolase (beta-lactamase superfamily II)
MKTNLFKMLGSAGAAVALALLACVPMVAQAPGPAPQYEVYAVQYAVLAQFPVAALVAGADRARMTDITMMFWVIKGGGHVVLFDSGFYREKFLRQWKPQAFVKPSEAVGKLGLKPEEVTDVILSHAHWDHAGGAELFPNAQVWIQRDEYQYYTGEAWQPEAGADLSTEAGRRAANARHGGIDPEDMMALVKVNLDGRLRYVNGDDQAILPGIRCYTGGKHTFQSQYCSVNTRSGTVVLASDNAYLYENLEKRVPIAQTLDAASNLRAQDRMKQLATKPELIVPGHDPAVMQKFPRITDGVVRID